MVDDHRMLGLGNKRDHLERTHKKPTRVGYSEDGMKVIRHLEGRAREVVNRGDWYPW